MFNDLNDNIIVNRKLIRITSPTIALYLAELMVILKEVTRKSAYNPETGFWKLNRQFVRDEVGIETADQRIADSALAKLEILEFDPENSDKLRINMKKYFEIISDDSIGAVLPKTSKLTAKEKKEVKENSIKAGIVNLFNETNEISLNAVKDLVNVYYARGYCRHEQWRDIITMLHACTTDPTGIKEIIDYVLSTNYVSIPAGIESFMKKHAPTATKLNTKQETCSGTLAGVEFK